MINRCNLADCWSCRLISKVNRPLSGIGGLSSDVTATGRDANGKMGRVVAIANQKGGVGKTTTAVNLGASLAAAERSVLIVDMDPQGNASSGLGYPRGEVDLGVYQALTGEARLSEVVVGTDLERLYVVPATEDLAGAGVELDRKSVV